jgi:hypothetical protein
MDDTQDSGDCTSKGPGPANHSMAPPAIGHLPPNLPSAEQREYLDAMMTWANGERMVPENFVGGLSNVNVHFAHWEAVANLLHEGERLIELGCGCGLPARIYSLRTRCAVVAMDQPAAIEMAQRCYPTPGVVFFGADFNEPLEVGKYDVVVCTDVLEHVQEKDVLLQTMAGCDTGQTRYILTVPIGPTQESDPNPWHLHWWATVEEFLADVGRFLPLERVVVV